VGSQVAEVAERLGVSRQSGHDLGSSLKDGGIAALADQSRRPHHHPVQLEAEAEVFICELGRTHLRCPPDPPRVGPLVGLDALRPDGRHPPAQRVGYTC
jgi:hypothetical protein